MQIWRHFDISEEHFIHFEIKPCQYKKGKSFAVMLGFCMSFFEFASAACYKKKTCKKRESQQTLGCSYFVIALALRSGVEFYNGIRTFMNKNCTPLLNFIE
jgi:hypothetical protein